MKPKIFIASSSENLDIAYAIQTNLDREAEVTVWTQGVFDLSRTAMASLVDQLDLMQFAIFVFSPDDVTKIRNRELKTIRDNVIFELGLFIGRLGTDRCFIVIPVGSDDLHLPTDLIGLTPATFDPNRQDRNHEAALGAACNRIRRAIARIYVPNQAVAAQPLPTHDDSPPSNVHTDENDCKSILQSWMGARSSSQNRQVIFFEQVDQQLNLRAGATKDYIEEIARRWGYVVLRRGVNTVIFEDGRRI